MAGWRKLGLRVGPRGRGLQQTHAMLPTPLLLDDRIRVFYAACDSDLRGRIFYADLALDFPHDLLSVSEAPSLDLGPASSFDADGVNPSTIMVDEAGRLSLYYIGWQRHSSEVPYTLIAGLAVSTDEGRSFTRVGRAVLPPTEDEPYFRTAPFVWRAGSEWRMLYIGGGRFFDGPDGKRLPIYALRSAVSADGREWTSAGPPLLEPDTSAGEIGFGRPVLWHDEAANRVLMLSRRTITGYSLVEAPFSDAGVITGDFAPVIDAGPDPWDSEMTCFGSPLVVGDRELLFYNGNRFGWSGFGLAWRPAQGRSA